jgi:hypothetical protein
MGLFYRRPSTRLEGGCFTKFLPIVRLPTSSLPRIGLVQPNPYWRFQPIYGLLWSRGNILRSRALSSYNPFAVLPDAAN